MSDEYNDLADALIEGLIDVWVSYTFREPIGNPFEEVAKAMARICANAFLSEIYGTGECAGDVVDVMEVE